MDIPLWFCGFVLCVHLCGKTRANGKGKERAESEAMKSFFEFLEFVVCPALIAAGVVVCVIAIIGLSATQERIYRKLGTLHQQMNVNRLDILSHSDEIDVLAGMKPKVKP
jgi:hypothetical protein